MRIPDWVQEVLASFDQKQEAHGELQIVDEFDRARKLHGDLSDDDFKGYVADRSAFFFRGHAGRNSVWGTYFGPMAILPRAGGGEVRVPDIKELDAEVVAHWEARARLASDPVMRARYADVAWDLKQAISNERPSHEFALIAIDAYLLATRERLYTMEIEAVNWLKRALSLALSTRDTERTKLVAAHMFEFYDQAASPLKPGVWIFPFDTLYEKKNLLTPEQESKIITDLARTSSGKPEESDPHGAQAAAERLAQHYKRQNDKENVERVVRMYGSAFERLSKDASPMLATAWLQPVIERYEQEGLKQEAERLQLMHSEKGKNIASDLKEVSAPVEIKKEDIEREVERLIGSGTRVPAVSLARAGESTRRVGFDLYDSQSSEVSQDMLRIKEERLKEGGSWKRMLPSAPIMGAAPSESGCGRSTSLRLVTF